MLSSLKKLVTDSMAIDLGTATTLIAVRGRGVVVDEPSLVAINERTEEIIAFGQDAADMRGREGRDIAVMRPDGALTQGLTGDEYYKFALAREPYSPDLRYRAVVAPDDREILQIWIQDESAGTLRLVTHLSRGIAYDPVWSPDGGKIAYVSRETGSDEIYIYDLGSDAHTQITRGGNPFIYKQRPTWSPDGSHLAFKSNDGTPNFQIWLVRADGSELQNLSHSASNDTDPV
ncbi:MAG: hypothetical protein DYH05_13570, partial [Acidobacteria bacterium ACB1]|nr:hypothetical protein [Acidobacteria bacterium ACB1]